MGMRTHSASVMAEYALTLSELGQIDQAVIVGREAMTIAQKAGNRTFVGLGSLRQHSHRRWRVY
jgi:hypothetical protein